MAGMADHKKRARGAGEGGGDLTLLTPKNARPRKTRREKLRDELARLEPEMIRRGLIKPGTVARAFNEPTTLGPLPVAGGELFPGLDPDLLTRHFGRPESGATISIVVHEKAHSG